MGMETEEGCECQLCGGRRGVVFCGAHAARLCLQCDQALHQPDGGEHPRAPLCDSCNAAAAELRLRLCVTGGVTLCGPCAYTQTNPSHSSPVTTYTGCPAPLEMMRLLFLPATFSLQQQKQKGAMAMPPPPLQHLRNIHKREERNRAKLRYNDKKKRRKFSKQIKYACRKAGADTRKRVKGRFAKASSSSSSSSIDHRS
uniref:CCT domain-containing protein n=1 Tax=Oryza punctata TaxID=4537 RepID=A0A0E0L6Q6_ORYPU